MSKLGRSMSPLTKGMLLLIIGVIGLFYFPLLLLIYVPFVSYYVWTLDKKVKALEERPSEPGKS